MFLIHGSRCFSTLCILFVFLVISACTQTDNTVVPIDQKPVSAKLTIPPDNVELERFLKAELVKNYQYRDLRYYYATNGGTTVIQPPVSSEDSSANTQMYSSSATPHSSTNVQENGVDEGDLVKTDGRYLYLARGSRFIVMQGQPADHAAIVSDIDLTESIGELHLIDNRVIIITTPYSVASSVSGNMSAAVSSMMPLPVVRATRVYCYDISDPVSPALTTRFDFPGFLQGSRRINATVYLITNYHIDLPSPVSAWDYLPSGYYSMDFYSEASAQAAAENVRRIHALTLDEMIPTYSRTIYAGGVPGTASVFPMAARDDIYLPESGNGTDVSFVIALDSAADTPVVACSGVISSWCQMYMSPENLYLASSNYWSWVEPVNGIAQIASNPEPWSALHKFALAHGVGKPLYSGSGIAKGWINNQFSMGEYNGYLRIGTTRGGWWGEGISNRLAVFSEQDGALVEKGAIEGLAQGEKIYSMRFDRDRGYMVTFKQTDPLFTFDLSDPQNPRKTGELEVNGFATYIHLLGQDNRLLLTVGRSADASGRVTGNKLQLFDVANLAAPVLLGNFELGDGWSAALYDYHAFLYYEPLGILAIPYYRYGSVSSPGLYSSGLRVFTIGVNGISERGTIPSKAISSGYGSYADTVDRSVIIRTDIYSIAHRTVTVAGTALLDIKKIVELPEGYYGYYAQPL